MWSGLLADGAISDVKFMCSHNESVGGLKLVRANASEVFANLFSGEWKESAANEVDVSDCSASSIRALLALMYTGALACKSCDEAAELLALACWAFQAGGTAAETLRAALHRTAGQPKQW